MKMPDFFDGHPNMFKPLAMEAWLLDYHDLVYTPQLGFYEFDEIWRQIRAEELRKEIKEILEESYEPSQSDRVIKSLMDEVYIDFSAFKKNKNRIVLKNGTLDISDWKNPVFYENEFFRNDYSTIQLDCSYNPKAKYQQFKKFLRDIFNNDQEMITLVSQMFGYCLTPSTKYETFFVLYGNGSNGKSTLLNLLIALLTPENICNVSINQLKSDFERIQLFDKLACISSELEGYISSTSLLKQVVSGEPISAAKKFHDSFVFRPHAKLVYAVNELPRVKDTSKGFFRRLTLIPFEKTFEGANKDVDLKEKLLEELDGILLFALEGLRSLAENNGFVEPNRSQEIKAKYIDDVDVTKSILNNLIAQDSNGTVVNSSLMAEYQSYCTKNGFKYPLNAQNLGKKIKQYYPDAKTQRETINGQKDTVYYGISLM